MSTTRTKDNNDTSPRDILPHRVTFTSLSIRFLRAYLRLEFHCPLTVGESDRLRASFFPVELDFSLLSTARFARRLSPAAAASDFFFWRRRLPAHIAAVRARHSSF